MASERAMGWSYRIASSRGVNGRLAENDRMAMATAGLPEVEIAGVSACLDAMRKSGALAPTQARIREIIEDVGALPTPGNVARAESIYLRALGEALLCQTALNIDPGSASNLDPPGACGGTPLISPAKRVGAAQPG